MNVFFERDREEEEEEEAFSSGYLSHIFSGVESLWKIMAYLL
jgi:hypothetical protein